MKRINSLLIAVSAFFSFTIQAQIEGDSIFATDQVLTIELNFSQPAYWDSLVANYATETYMSADMVITTIDGARTFPNVGIRFKGNSTYNHPNNKKPFKIDFNKYVSGQNFDGIKKLNLSNGFKDPSCMREKLFFDFCHDAGVLAPRSNFADLYINGTLWGFYTVVEQIDDQFLDWAILDDNGNLFKAGDNFGGGPGGGGTPADLKYYGSTAADYTDRYELKTNETANDWTDLIDLIDFINNSTDADFGNLLASRIEKQAFFRSFAIDNLFGNLDSYTGSARNYYLYHNMTSDKWEWVKWDANEAFGSYTNQQVPVLLDVEYHNADRPLLERIFANSNLNAEYKNEICDLMETYFNNAYMDPKIDVIYNLIKSHVYADNNKMYSNTDFDNNITSDITSGGGPGGGTIYGLKSFITARVNNVNGQIDCNYYNSLNELQEVQFKMYPNPANNYTVVEIDGIADQLEIRTITGQLLMVKDINGAQSVQLPLEGIASGMYLVNIYAGESVNTSRLVIER